MIARLTSLLVLAPVAIATAQDKQPDFRWEKALQANAVVKAHNLSGDVTVTQVNTGKVEVIGRKHGDKRDFDRITLVVVETRDGIVVCPDYKDLDMECNEDGFHVHNDRWGRRGRNDYDDLSIDIEIKVPKGTEVGAGSVSGNVSVVGAEGDVRASSVSGDVRMERLRATSVKATSVSGNVDVTVESLTGTGDLKFTSVSGNVTAELPKNIDADVTMHSVSGSFDSDFPLTLSGRMNRGRIEARIGRGGRDLSITTVSGNVRLRAIK
jgi:DUF4097 and DUF4098 domain-containing protein YvlB